VHARSHAAPQARVAPLTDASRSELEDEDEAYLQVLRSLRQGRQVEARERAALYLQKFPHAFRRAEIEGLTGIR
jgi:hypothetical protein